MAALLPFYFEIMVGLKANNIAQFPPRGDLGLPRGVDLTKTQHYEEQIDFNELRTPFLQRHGFPRIAEWGMNLTALSQKHNVRLWSILPCASTPHYVPLPPVL
jgi:hypothetical protein